MNLEMRQLEAFAATARTGSFTAAARELGVGQPAVSQAVRRLESQLGVVLFERSGRSVTPTGAATVLLPYAETTLDALAAAQRIADEVAHGRAGTLRLVSTPGSLGLLADLLEDFAAAYPDARIDLVPRPAHGRRVALRRSEIDLALVRSTPPTRGISYTSVQREPWLVILSAHHPLVAAPEPLDLAALSQWPFASLASDDTSPALAAYEAAVRDLSLTPRQGPVVNAFDDLLARVLTGTAWTLLTSTNAAPLIEGLVALPVPVPIKHAEVWLAHRTRTAPLERALLAIATQRADQRRWGHSSQ